MVSLKVDPRTVTTFAQLGIKDTLLKLLPENIQNPLPIQKKVLCLNTSGINSFVESVPRQGKTTACIMGLLSTTKEPPPHLTNLVLVPSPALADQYKDYMTKFSGSDPLNYQVLYRTGSEYLDEQQHIEITNRDGIHLHTLIATPQRLLDYLSYAPETFSLGNLRQLVIDELDVFKHSDPEKSTPLETLVEYILSSSSKEPIINIMTSRRAQFSKLPLILQKCKRPLYEVSEKVGEWNGTIKSHKLQGDFAQQIKKEWTGPGLVVPPPSNCSPSQLQADLGDSGAIVTRSQEVAGLNIENLQNIYVLGEHPESDVDRLKWMMNDGTLHLFS